MPHTYYGKSFLSSVLSMLPPDMAITDQLNSVLKVNIASNYGVNGVGCSSFADMVTYIIFPITFLKII